MVGLQCSLQVMEFEITGGHGIPIFSNMPIDLTIRCRGIDWGQNREIVNEDVLIMIATLITS